MDSLADCPLCHQTLPQSQLQRHANSHFDDSEEERFNRDLELAQQLALEESSSSSSSSYSCSSSSSITSSSIVDEKVSSLLAFQIRSPFYQVNVDSDSGGLMGLLRKCLELELESKKMNTCNRVLLSGYVDHYQSIPSEDVGWGCGWRNIQMLASYLFSCRSRNDASNCLFGGCGFVPDIPFLQRWLEIAWDSGFDPFGAQHFNHSVYASSKWIGTTECAALFRSFGFRARIVDFGPKEFKSLFLSVPGVHPTSQVAAPNAGLKRKMFPIYGPMDRYLIGRNQNVSQPDSSVSDNTGCSAIQLSTATDNAMANYLLTNNKGGEVLLDWVWNYFSKDISATSAHHSPVIVTDKGPLFFQHDGHSRTIVGIEANQQQNGKLQYNLLILDPGHRTLALERSLKENAGWKKLIKRGGHTLKKPQYQLCYIDPGLASKEEMEKLKTMDSTFMEF